MSSRERRFAGAVILLAVLVSGCATSGAPGMTTDARRDAATTNTQLGIRYLQRGEPQRALKKLNKALAQDPDYSNAHMVTGVAYERLDKPDIAAEYYAEAVELAPDNAPALNNYGRFLCERDQPDRAIELFQRAADNPLYEKPYLPLANAGICLLNNAGDAERAENFLLRSLNANGRFAPALIRMAELRYDNREYLSARGYLQRYLEVAPQNARAAWLGVRIERELGDEDAVASYSMALRNRFPDSRQTRQLLDLEHDE